jgi:hypothetical protein
VARISSIFTIYRRRGFVILLSVAAQPGLFLMAARAATPKAPPQVELPSPPPMRYMAGLDEPLVATGPVTEEETKDLDAALAAFRDAPATTGEGGDYDDYAKPLQAFLAAHPGSNWNAALYANLGFGYYRAGYYSRTFSYLEQAWTSGRAATSPQARLLIDRAVGELAKMHARVGHAEELEALFNDIGKRPIGGPATELIQGAHEGLWTFRHHPEIAYLCGPSALRNLLLALKANSNQIKFIDDAHSGSHGFSLQQLAKLSDKAELKYKLIYRRPGQPVPVPSVINWNTHHYAAIVGQERGLYQLKDPTFGSGGGLPLTARAIDAESSGYFLVPSHVVGQYPQSGWRTVDADSAEASTVYGMGTVYADPPSMTTCADQKTSQQCSGTKGMAIASGHIMTVSLNLMDTPGRLYPAEGRLRLDDAHLQLTRGRAARQFQLLQCRPEMDAQLDQLCSGRPQSSWRFRNAHRRGRRRLRVLDSEWHNIQFRNGRFRSGNLRQFPVVPCPG